MCPSVLWAVILPLGLSLAEYQPLYFVSGGLHSTRNPGLKLTVSQKGINYAAKVAIQQLSARVTGKTLPDQHEKYKKFDVDITGMRVNHFTPPSASVSVQAGKGATLVARGAGIALHGDWRYKKRGWIKLRGHGSFDVSISGASLSVGITMGKDRSGRPTILATSCFGSPGHVSVKFHGHLSWLYNLFRHKIAKALSKKINGILCTAVKKGINTDAVKALARMKVQIPIKKTPLTIDYRLLTSPVFGPGYIQSSHKGEFFWKSDQSEAPFAPQATAQPETTQKMVTICLADYVTNTLGYVLNKHGLLKHTMTKRDLPAEKRGFLNTTCSNGLCIGTAIMELGKKFPNSSVEIFMQTTSAPSLHTSPNDVTGRFNGTVTFNVRQPNGTVTLGFSAHTVANVSLTGQISLKSGNRITAKVNNITFHMRVTHSNIGPISDTYLNTVFGFAVKGFIIPQMNEIGKEGFVLPSVDVVQFVNPQIYILQNTLCFGTDAKYVPRDD